MTKVHADQIDIPSLADLLTGSSVSVVSSRVNTAFATAVERARKRNAFDATWKVTRTATLEANKPWIEVSRTVTEYTVSILKIADTHKQSATNVAANVDLINKQSIVLFPPITFEPSTEDTLIYGGITYRVLSIEPVAPSNVTLFWMVSIVQ